MGCQCVENGLVTICVCSYIVSIRDIHEVVFNSVLQTLWGAKLGGESFYEIVGMNVEHVVSLCLGFWVCLIVCAGTWRPHDSSRSQRHVCTNTRGRVSFRSIIV